MRPGSAEPDGGGTPGTAASPAPLLVLALGNTLLRDDGLGQELARLLEGELRGREGEVELLDGGTQGMALLGRLEGRTGVLLLDAVARGAPPGTVHAFDGRELLASPRPRGTTAHEGSAEDLLRLAALVDLLPPQVRVVGIEPAEVRTGLGLSDTVRSALPAALTEARRALASLRSPSIP